MVSQGKSQPDISSEKFDPKSNSFYAFFLALSHNLAILRLSALLAFTIAILKMVFISVKILIVKKNK